MDTNNENLTFEGFWKTGAEFLLDLGVPDEVVNSDTEVDDLGLDSLDLVEFIMNLEEIYCIDIPDDVAEPKDETLDQYARRLFAHACKQEETR